MKRILIASLILSIFAIAFIVTPNLTNPTGFAVAIGEDNENNVKRSCQTLAYTPVLFVITFLDL